MPTIIENINNIISTKSELKTILTENGLEPSENFNEYPDMFRSIVGSGSIDEAALNGYISSYLDTYSFIDQTALSANSYLTSADLSAYATKSYVADYVASYGGDMSDYLPLTGGEITGPLYVSYQQTNNTLYGFKSYSHIVAGDENKTTPAFLASKRYCANGVGSYINMASFFVNGDGRAKFAHKSSAGGGSDDAFMCFNAYGFKLAYSGAAGTAASTEYDIIHSGNINDYISGGNVTIDENIVPKANYTYTLGTSSYIYKTAYVTDLYTSVHNRISNRGDNQMNIQLNNAWRYVFHVNNFSPASDNTINLGASDAKWKAAYSYSLYATVGYLGTSPIATEDYVATYVATYGGGGSATINENIIPKENNAYTLGDSTYQYAATYTYFVGAYNSGMSIDSAHGIIYNINGNNRFTIANSSMRPITNNYFSLGASNNQWKATYSYSLYLNGTEIRDSINGMFSYNSTTGILTITTL